MTSRSPTDRSLLAKTPFVVLASVVIALVAGGAALALSPQLTSGWKAAFSDTSVAAKTGEDPQLDGDYVAYLDTTYRVVSLYRISTGQTTQIAVLPQTAQADSLCIDGRYVAWNAQSSEAANRGVWLYDILGGGAPQRLFLAQGVDLDVDGGRVVWKAASMQANAGWDLYVYDVGANAILPLGLDDWGISDAMLDGDHLVWVQGVGGQRDVMMYEFSTDTRLDLSGARGSGLADYDPCVSGGRVVWVGEDGSDSEVFLYYRASGTVHRLTDDSNTYREPLVDGRWVTWPVGSDLMMADALAADPAASARFVMGNGGGASETYYSHALGGGWAVSSRGGCVWRYDIATKDLAQATEQAIGMPGARRAFVVQTNGRQILAKVDKTELYLLEEAAPGATTTVPPSTTTTQPPNPGGNIFSDVPASHPYHDAIIGMADQGIINGYTDGTFGPDRRVWRQHFAKMIVGTMGFPCSEADHCAFSDVDVGGPTTLYPDNYIAVAAAFGITKGIGGGKFAPYNDITRAQVITMVVRAAQEYTNGLSAPDAAYYGGWGLFRTFRDPTHGYNAHLAEFNGLLTGIQGSGDVSWWAYQPATRGEVAQILWNLAQVPGLAG